MTTTVRVTTHNKPAHICQTTPARFDGETHHAAIDGVPVTVPANSEMTFYVHDALDITVSESAPVAAE